VREDRGATTDKLRVFRRWALIFSAAWARWPAAYRHTNVTFFRAGSDVYQIMAQTQGPQGSEFQHQILTQNYGGHYAPILETIYAGDS